MVSQTIPRTAANCEQIVSYAPGWTRSVPVPCGQVVGLSTWHDETGVKHAACPRHIAELRHRYPTYQRTHVDHERFEADCAECQAEVLL